MPTVGLVVVTHDSGIWLPQFATSWRKAIATCGGGGAEKIEVHIADSGSRDHTCELARQLLPEAILQTCGNIGFGAAANAAIREMTASWIVLSNPDVTFSSEFLSSLHAIIGVVDRIPSDVSCIAPRLLNADGSLQPSVGLFPTIITLLQDQCRPRQLRKYLSSQPSSEAPIDWASGACLIFQRDSFLAAGGFDEKYFLYVEEVDLQRRLREMGKQILFVPSLQITHHQPNAARPPRPDVQRWAARGMLRYFARFSPFISLPLYRLLACASGRLTFREALASRKSILGRTTGP